MVRKAHNEPADALRTSFPSIELVTSDVSLSQELIANSVMSPSHGLVELGNVLSMRQGTRRVQARRPRLSEHRELPCSYMIFVKRTKPNTRIVKKRTEDSCMVRYIIFNSSGGYTLKGQYVCHASSC